MKTNKARKISFTAVFTAFSIAFLYLSSVFPTGQLGFLGIASLFGVAAVIEYGTAGGLFVFAGTALIGLMLVPDKMLVVLYSMFFGYYPVLKSIAEKMRSRTFEWVVKLAVFNIALSIILFIFSFTLFETDIIKNSYVVMYIFCNAVFVAFDVGVSRLICFYTAKIFPKIHSK
ncbi:MAG: hypothetical protein ACI3VB_06315 [Oscillospiraceae bacterium]